MKTSKFTKLILGIAIVMLLTASIAFGADNMGRTARNISRVERPQIERIAKEDLLAKVKDRLDAMVARGIITQQEADELYAKVESGELNIGEIFSAYKPAPKEKLLARVRARLDAMVARGIITQQEANELYAKVESGELNIGEIFSAYKPTPKERPAARVRERANADAKRQGLPQRDAKPERELRRK